MPTRSAALEVGVLIEGCIEELAAAIAAEDEADVTSVHESLLPGSENHPAACQRCLMDVEFLYFD